MSTEQAMNAMDLMVLFMQTDHEDDAGIPGPYEQGANLPERRVTFEEYWD